MSFPPALAALLADAVLVLHVAVAVFVVAMTLAVPVGGMRAWHWIRRRSLRLVHVALVAVIALQAWLGRLCPLTIWEQALRAHAGQPTHDVSFVGYWLSRLLFFDVPWWVFVLAYSVLAALVVGSWWRWPPAGSGTGSGTSGTPGAPR